MSNTLDDGIMCINKTGIATVHRYIFSQNDYKYFDQVFMLQIGVVSLMRAILEWFLKPLGFTSVVAHILSGQILGAAGLSRMNDFKILFNPDEVMTRIEMLGSFAVMIYAFLAGVKLDVSTVMRSSRKAWVLGISTYIVPLIFTLPLAFYLKEYVLRDTKVGPYLPLLAVLTSTTSFHAINSFLFELKILNTELGRQATSISAISCICGWITLVIFVTVMGYSNRPAKHIVGFVLSVFAMLIFISMVLRKVVIWIIKRTPNGETINNIDLFIIFLMIPTTGLIGEIIGVHQLHGPLLLGLAIPDGPPIGSAMTERLECLIYGVFLPIYFLVIGNSISDHDFLNLFPGSFEWTTLFIALGFLGKFVGTIIPCLYHQVSFKDAATLGITLTTLGIFDVIIYHGAFSRKLIHGGIFSTLIFGVIIVATITSLLVRWFCKPSRNYFFYKNRMIQNTKYNEELRLLVCIYNENNVPAIVNLMEASNPTKSSSIHIYLLHLMELYGSSSPYFITHQRSDRRRLEKPTPSDRIVNCLRIYEKQNHGIVSVNAFTSGIPFTSAHEDVCAMALNNQTSLIIIPFHKQWNVNGITESFKCRNVNKKVLSKAPCTVGILIDRGRLNNVISVVSCWSTYNIGVIFLGGPDDREALSYAMRMAEHLTIRLTVHRIVPTNMTINNLNEKILDDNFINEYRLKSAVSGKNMYKEEVVEKGLEIVCVIRAIEKFYDLIIVGVQQENYSSLLAGLTEWNEYPEIGFFGDMLASPDFKGNISILVIQQRSSFAMQYYKTESNDEAQTCM